MNIIILVGITKRKKRTHVVGGVDSKKMLDQLASCKYDK